MLYWKRERMLNLKVQGKLPQGRPWQRWINQVKKNLQERGYDWEELKRKAWEIEINGGIFEIDLPKGGHDRRMMMILIITYLLKHCP